MTRQVGSRVIDKRDGRDWSRLAGIGALALLTAVNTTACDMSQPDDQGVRATVDIAQANALAGGNSGLQVAGGNSGLQRVEKGSILSEKSEPYSGALTLVPPPAPPAIIQSGCAHDVCTVGRPLSPKTCFDWCVDVVVNQGGNDGPPDPYCGSANWDSTCVDEARRWCLRCR